MVFWFVLVTKNRAANDATNAAGAHEGCRAEGTLPLPADVVRLPGKYTGDVGVTGDSGKENTKIADSVVACEAEKGQTLRKV